MNAKLYKTEKENYVLVDPTKGTYDDGYMLGTSRESQFNKLSLKNCQAIERGYDVYELAKENYHKFWSVVDESEMLDHTFGYVEGFQKAVEILGDKKFSEDDMRMAYGRQFDSSFPEFLQLLQQTEWDVEIVMQEDKDVLVNDVREFLENLGDKPLLDADGCLILKLKSE